VVNLILPSQLVENLITPVERAKHPVESGGEYVGKTMIKIRIAVMYSSDSLFLPPLPFLE